MSESVNVSWSPPIRQRLKSERVQEMLQVMPAWRFLRKSEAIRRVFEFPSEVVAATFATHLVARAEEEGHKGHLSVAKTKVSVTLSGPGRNGDLTEEIVAFAQSFG